MARQKFAIEVDNDPRKTAENVDEIVALLASIDPRKMDDTAEIARQKLLAGCRQALWTIFDPDSDNFDSNARPRLVK